MKEHAERIFDVTHDVEANWTATDGGLTCAATDVLRLGHRCLHDLDDLSSWSTDQLKEELDQVWGAIWRANTGAESDILGAFAEAIREELARRKG